MKDLAVVNSSSRRLLQFPASFLRMGSAFAAFCSL
jgi:hypothetical protein